MVFLYILAGSLLAIVLLYHAIRRKLWIFASPPSKVYPIFDINLVKNPPKEYPVEIDQTKRDKVLKNSFSLEKVPSQIDAIVIGSGLGGLSAASLLSRAGKRVLVLEQHDQAGGCCHVFIEKGFEFDVGIHYIGKMNPGNNNRLLSDQLTNGRLQWVTLDDIYDILAMGKDYETKYYVRAGKERQIQSFVEQFPNEEKAIRLFYKKMEEAVKASTAISILKVVPKVLSTFLLNSGLLQWFFPSMKYLSMTVKDVLDELTTNHDLRALLTYCYGNYGTAPASAPFLMHALLLLHFADGCYYPKGGSSEIAYNIIPTIEAAGGRVLVRVKVKEILIEGGAAVGVKVMRGKQEYELRAPIIISDAGLMNTVMKLLPREVTKANGMDRLVKRVKPGPGFFMIFIGLDGTKEDLGLKAQNMWAFADPDVEKASDKYFSLSAEDAACSEVPLIFLSFPSAKDPTFNSRYPGKSTCAVVTVTPYEWFEEWKDEKVQHRGPDYTSFKTRLGQQIWQQVCKLFPQLEDKMEYIEVGTPLSNQYYLDSYRGEVYGLDHDIKRFDPSVQAELRPETPIPGLYLTGQDVMTDGFSGAMFGGLLSASAILKRNLMTDLLRLRSKWKSFNETAKKSS